MKKRISLIALIAFTAGAMVFTGCKKDDTTPPSITLTGGDVTQNISDTYSEPGFTATDDEDGDITSSVTFTGLPTNGSVGEYTVTYSVSDAAGNTASATRMVTIKSDQLAGNYAVSDVVTSTIAANNGTYTYNTPITQSSTAYNKILISNFGGFGNSVTVTATVSGSTLTIASQSPSGMPTGNEGTISGTGTVSGTGVTHIDYTLNYNAGGTDTGSATYTKL
jgi:hypothetical protein